MKYSTNYNMNKPDLSEQYRLDHWNDNTDIIDTELKRNANNITNAETALQNAINDESSRATNAETALQNITNSAFKTALLNFCYPVGSLYWSSKSTNPSTLFGGTWTRIKDRFVLAAGDTYTTVPEGNATSGDGVGGSATVKLTESNLPAHNHGGITGSTQPSFKGNAVWGAFAAYGTEKEHCWARGVFSMSNSSVDYGADHSRCEGAVFEFNMTPSGTVEKHSHTISPVGGNISHENMPPYLVKFCWERIS